MKYEIEEASRVKRHRDILQIIDVDEQRVQLQFVSDRGHPDGETVIDLGLFKINDFKRVGKSL